jgi:hypothetical protein
MFCAGLLLSIADLLNLQTANLPTARPQPGHEQTQSNSMFPKALALLREQGGTTPPAATPKNKASRLPADVSTIRRSQPHFNWNLDSSLVKVDSCTRNVQTLLDPTTHPGTLGCDSAFWPFITASNCFLLNAQASRCGSGDIFSL